MNLNKASYKYLHNVCLLSSIARLTYFTVSSEINKIVVSIAKRNNLFSEFYYLLMLEVIYNESIEEKSRYIFYFK